VEPEIRISEYTYSLPEDKIAKYPLPNRDDSKILIFENNSISDSKFSNLDNLLPEKSIMVINRTKVIPARLFFRKESGALIEIFCLEPVDPSEYNSSFATRNNCVWLCVAGNAKKWKGADLFYESGFDKSFSAIDLRASLIDKKENKFIVKFSWRGGLTFSEIIELCGNVPIPPYLKRVSEELDTERYQTTYAEYRGSVAAPTAGLHFTKDLLDRIKEKSVEVHELCLHVGAGTFIPVKSELISEHKMHSEPYVVSMGLIKDLLERGNRKVISVGTTSLRCLESLFYLGVHCIEKGDPGIVGQWEPYQREYDYSFDESIAALLKWMEENKIKELSSRTSLIIVPSFRFRCADVLITNFHQPGSTLLLLVAAFAGNMWREIYTYALNNNFRFLSYGDSSILFRHSL